MIVVACYYGVGILFACLVLSRVKEDLCDKWKHEHPHATGRCPHEE